MVQKVRVAGLETPNIVKMLMSVIRHYMAIIVNIWHISVAVGQQSAHL